MTFTKLYSSGLLVVRQRSASLYNIAYVCNVSFMRNVNRPASLTDFDEWGRFLRGAIQRARKREAAMASLPPLATVYGTLRSEAYGYLFKLKKARLLGKLQAHIAVTGSFARGPNVSDSAWVLRLIEPKRGTVLTRSTRSRVARELDVALKNDVDPELVLGFLYEVGAQTDVLEKGGRKSLSAVAKRYAA